MKKEKVDMVNHPPHYQSKDMEVIEVIEAYELDYCRACAVKYILRAEKKDNNVEDIKKAIWYLERYLLQQENN